MYSTNFTLLTLLNSTWNIHLTFSLKFLLFFIHTDCYFVSFANKTTAEFHLLLMSTPCRQSCDTRTRSPLGVIRTRSQEVNTTTWFLVISSCTDRDTHRQTLLLFIFCVSYHYSSTKMNHSTTISPCHL